MENIGGSAAIDSLKMSAMHNKKYLLVIQRRCMTYDESWVHNQNVSTFVLGYQNRVLASSGRK